MSTKHVIRCLHECTVYSVVDILCMYIHTVYFHVSVGTHKCIYILLIGTRNLGGKKEQEIKEQYQEKLGKMEAELKQLKAALKQHQQMIKSKVLYNA